MFSPVCVLSPEQRPRLVGRPFAEALRGGESSGRSERTGPPGEVSWGGPLPEEVLRPADLWLFRTGPRGLAQVECVRQASRALVPRMLFYRDVITGSHPDEPLDQYVIVTGDGRLRGFDDPVHTGDHFGLHLLYLRDVDPAAFAASPGFALLGRCTEPPRLANLLTAVNMAFGRFLISLQDDVHDEAVLYDNGSQARAGIPEQLLSWFFQGRFGAHPDVPFERQAIGWPIDITVSLAVHAITDFPNVRRRALYPGQG